jgi:mitochondrial ribonuclease P protein 3
MANNVANNIANSVANSVANSEKSSSKKEKDDLISIMAHIKNQNVEEVDYMEPVQCHMRYGGWTVDENCSIDPNSGEMLSRCLQGFTLNPLQVATTAWQKMMEMNETIVTLGKVAHDHSEYQGGGKGRKKNIGHDIQAERTKHWNIFKSYLNHRQQNNPIDIVIDGANVGYYDTNYAGAPKHVSYDQINSLIQHLVHSEKKSILLIIHTQFESNMMSREFQPLLQSWIDHDYIYRTPPGMNDDWFWFHTALFSGPQTYIITNDEMRDHQFQMLTPRSFLRWKDRQQIHFTFGEWQSPNQRHVILYYPKRYSRRIQRVQDGIVIPHPKRDDTNRFLDGTFVAGPEEPIEETYVCIRPNTM